MAVARLENTAMRWNADRTGLTAWGHGPALAEYVPLTVTLPWPEMHAARLDPAGTMAADLPVEKAGARTVRAPRSSAVALVLAAPVMSRKIAASSVF